MTVVFHLHVAPIDMTFFFFRETERLIEISLQALGACNTS